MDNIFTLTMMKASVFLGLCFICAVSSQAQDQSVFPTVCEHGADTDLAGNIQRCTYRERCPYTSRCEYIFGSQGICCNKRPTTTQQCENGEAPLKGVSCGGFIGRPCPNTRRYKCVTNPFIADALGVCCPRRTSQSQCQRYGKIGSPLPGVSCGGFRLPGTGQCPPRYDCVGEALAWDGPGVCCRNPDPEPLVCPDGRQPTEESCGGWSGQQCSRPRLYECITDSAIPDSQGICCRRQVGVY